MSKQFKANPLLSVDEIHYHRERVVSAIRLRYTPHNPKCETLFLGYTVEEINEQKGDVIREYELTACLNLLATIEAAFRMDYVNRVQERKKDDLSRKFRELYNVQVCKVSLENDII